MTVLDTFTINVKTSDTDAAKSDLNSIDKKLDDMDKKVKKRTDEEKKHDAESKKRNKEKLDQIKDQEREIDKLSDSFQGMVQKGFGAVAAYASFSALKSGLIDANNLNNALLNLENTIGSTGNAVKNKAYGIAFAAATGGSATDFNNIVKSVELQSVHDRVPFDLQKAITQLRGRFHNLSPEQLKSQFSADPFIQFLTPLISNATSDAKFDESVKFGFGQAGTKADMEAARANQEEANKTKAAAGSIFTQVDTEFAGTVKMFNEGVQSFLGGLSGHPAAAAGLGAVGVVAGGAASIWASGKVFQGIKLAGGLMGGKGKLIAGAAILGAGLAAGYLGSHGGGSGENHGGGSGSWGGSGGSNKQKIYDFWLSKGYSPEAAAGWTANAQAESSFGLDPKMNSNGHFGVYQWSSSRRKKIKDGTGIDVANASIEDQLAAASWEASQGQYGLTPARFSGLGKGQSAALIDTKFEIPAQGAALIASANKRGGIAEGYGAISSPSVGGFSDGGNSGRAINIKIDDIRIETGATDATGIAHEVGAELKNQIRMAMSNIDDGILY